MMALDTLHATTGSPLPPGCTRTTHGVNFSLGSQHAERVTLCLFQNHEESPYVEFPLDPVHNRTGNTWHIHIGNIPENVLYAFKIDGSSSYVLDPYARSVATSNQWGAARKIENSTVSSTYKPRGWIPDVMYFDWESTTSPHLPLKDLVIYEMHVRGFTQHPSAQVQEPGTYLGIIEKIPHLLELGVNAVELLPIFEFNETENLRIDPLTGQPLCNYWGYSTVNFLSPMQRFAYGRHPGDAVREFKTLVRELHRNGIEVILDVVFNHTSEGGLTGPHYSFKLLDNEVYYMHGEDGKYLDFTGCGNTFNCNHPNVKDLIIKTLRYWVLEMHVDGFRFDLSSIFYRDEDGTPLAKSPLVEAISEDLILSQTKLIAEPWDAAGHYQVGTFYPRNGRWSEWNGKYRDSVRSFIKGTDKAVGDFATRLSGSQDLYYNRSPLCSLNFITAHDGFTLRDLVSYNEKHNMSNGEDNNDGMSWNESWNCGVEGDTDDPAVISLRERQMRNLHLALFVSQGIPMVLMGDEYGHTKKGNNNTWCHDNELNWFLWNELQKNQNFFRYFSKLIKLRKQLPILRLGRFLTDEDIVWHGLTPREPNWNDENRLLAFTLLDKKEGKDLYIVFNAFHEEKNLELPAAGDNKQWVELVNTGNEPPADITDIASAKPIGTSQLTLPPHSALLFLAAETR